MDDIFFHSEYFLFFDIIIPKRFHVTDIVKIKPNSVIGQRITGALVISGTVVVSG